MVVLPSLLSGVGSAAELKAHSYQCSFCRLSCSLCVCWGSFLRHQERRTRLICQIPSTHSECGFLVPLVTVSYSPLSSDSVLREMPDLV